MYSFSVPSFRSKYPQIILVTVLLFTVTYFLIYLQLNQAYYFAALWIVLVIVLFVYGNRILIRIMDKYLSWSKYVTLRFFLQLLISVVYSLSIVNVSYLLIKSLLTDDPPTIDQIIVMNLYGTILIIPIISIYYGIHFLKAWKKSELESEKIQKESIKSQLDSLKNNLDPHFLFNNLNILSALIDKDTEKSKEFLEKFADVYRFLLQSKGSELVSLQNELQFLDSYVYLIKSRFGDNVKIDIDITNNLDQNFLPPLTLQMLFENGIKHNVVSKDHPLHFKLYSENANYLVISNNLKEKRQKVESHNTGLKNIINRYSHFTDQQVFIENNGKEYVVKVPLLEIEEG